MNCHRSHMRILLIFLAAAAFGESINNEPQPPSFRLPDIAAPERYRVRLALAPGNESFSGTIDIDLTFKKSTSVLWLNAEKLKVKSADFASGGENLPVRILLTPSDFVGFLLGRPVGPGRARLQLSFEGQISSKDMAGIFEAKEDGRWYIYSQFENIAARRAFPCFDEPSYKVPWQISLTVPAHDSAFSNTPIRSQTMDKHDMKTVVFSETKPLPSYLVALAVGPFDVVHAGRAGANQTALRIIVPKGHSPEAHYAATTTAKLLDLLERYFGIPYPYEKLDQVAIPYAGYAMEHPGLVTYGSLFFLLKPDASLGLVREGTNVMAHELAHQWFGDLVTMQWWDDTWLNEAFASWMANKIVNQYRPQWNMNIDELNGYQRAMATDELRSSRKIRQEILSSDDIENAALSRKL
jgi:cytosol alanyl aminopeptidase